jgi:hypothetical protein
MQRQAADSVTWCCPSGMRPSGSQKSSESPSEPADSSTGAVLASKGGKLRPSMSLVACSTSCESSSSALMLSGSKGASRGTRGATVTDDRLGRVMPVPLLLTPLPPIPLLPLPLLPIPLLTMPTGSAGGRGAVPARGGRGRPAGAFGGCGGRGADMPMAGPVPAVPPARGGEEAVAPARAAG